MEQQRKVVTIPPTVSRFTAAPIAEQKKRRVAAYARVSTDSDEQFTSYEAQIEHYTEYISTHEGWVFATSLKYGLNIFVLGDVTYGVVFHFAGHHAVDGFLTEVVDQEIVKLDR